ncbi:winged helix-turn-helix transcriptional regulator [Kitasatospora sp. NPDC057015]|uniref:winged helix-turn-helix transcriptional regulator n=1 Tax=Kitasatospora sp. NPDC057015 TaxID=3346001 RepID=UPI0036359313
MPTSVVRDLAQAPQVQQAVSVLSPPNTISVLRTLDRNAGELPTYGFSDAMPWMGSKLAPRLKAMEAGGLLSKARSGQASVACLTVAGRDALRTQMPFTRWASAHQSVPESGTGMGAYTEQALASLNLTYTVATVWALASEGEPVYPSEIQDLVLPADGPHPSALYRRLAQLEVAGLVERSGEYRAYMYGLTQAGQDLMEPLEALARWAERYVPVPEASPAVPVPVRAEAAAVAPVIPSPVSAPPAAQPSPAAQAAGRAQAAAVRSVTTALAFSDHGAPQPAPLVSNSAPTRQR